MKKQRRRQQYYDGDRLRGKRVESGNTPVFTNDPLVAGVTQVKAAHLTELRDAVNQARARAGLPAATWTDGTVQQNVIGVTGSGYAGVTSYVNNISFHKYYFKNRGRNIFH